MGEYRSALVRSTAICGVSIDLGSSQEMHEECPSDKATNQLDTMSTTP